MHWKCYWVYLKHQCNHTLLLCIVNAQFNCHFIFKAPFALLTIKKTNASESIFS